MKATLDDGSLFDMTRYSEDSHFHQSEADKVAILEFELRRARQTIDSLRNELTQQVVAVVTCNNVSSPAAK